MKSTILIEKYLAGMLKGEKLRDFERQLNSSSELQELVILHKEINESIDEDEIIGFRNKLNRIYSRFKSSESDDVKEIMLNSVQSQKRPASVRRLAIVAASITLIMIIGALLYLSRDKVHTNSELFSMYYRPYEPDIIIRSDSKIYVELESAILLYGGGNYSAALGKFVSILENNNNNYLAQFYLGLTCMELNKFDVAIEQFNSIPEDWGSPFRYHLEWYLALCYINNNNVEEARVQLIKIKSANKYYKTKAEEILEKLS